MARIEHNRPGYDRNKIIDEVLNILRQQEDSKGELSIGGSIPVDPQNFSSGSHLVIGPIRFSTTFTTPPLVSFTQYGPKIASDVRVSPGASNYTPFLVQPYVYSWNWASGAVDGFYIGLYALTEPKEIPKSSTVVWQASGKASRYLDPLGEESWAAEDKSFTPHYLMENVKRR